MDSTPQIILDSIPDWEAIKSHISKDKDGRLMLGLPNGGALPFYDRVSQAISGPRQDYRPSDRALLKKYGSQPIVSITILRKPIYGYVHATLGVASAGQWQSLMKKYGFDEFFHLAILVHLADGNVIKVEKNEVITLTLNPKEGKEELMDLKTPRTATGLTLQQLLDLTQQNMGANYFNYNPFTNNCQVFVMNILNAGGWLAANPGAKSFIYQDITELTKELNNFTKSFSSFATDTAARINVLTQGKGKSSLHYMSAKHGGNLFSDVINREMQDAEYLTSLMDPQKVLTAGPPPGHGGKTVLDVWNSTPISPVGFVSLLRQSGKGTMVGGSISGGMTRKQLTSMLKSLPLTPGQLHELMSQAYKKRISGGGSHLTESQSIPWRRLVAAGAPKTWDEMETLLI